MKVEKFGEYEVIDDDDGFFAPGDIVVALECDSIPFCVLKENFKGSEATLYDYSDDTVSALRHTELRRCQND